MLLPPADTAALPPILQTALYSITAADLKGAVSFLASDPLQGRYTPSPGLDVAAEFVAAQFRAAGLDPGGDQDYFQTAIMIDRHMPKLQTDVILRQGTISASIPAQSVAVSDELRMAPRYAGVGVEGDLRMDAARLTRSADQRRVLCQRDRR